MNLEAQLTAQWRPTQVGRPGRVSLDGDKLVWSYNPVRQRLASPNPGTGTQRIGEPSFVPDVRTLETFVRLADAPAQEIVNFATNFGVLYICKGHGKPSSHQADHSNVGGFAILPVEGDWELDEADIASYAHLAERGLFNRCALNFLPPDEYWEPLDVWRKYAREARALLRIAADLRANRIGDDRDWISIGAKPLPENADLNHRRSLVSLVVDEWLEWGAVRPQLLWCDETADIAFGNRTLFGTLATQLLLAIAGTRAVAVCANCGILFRPKRHPRPGQRSYCLSPTCGRPAAVRNAAREYQRRKRARRSLE